MRMGFGVPVSGSWATPDNQVRVVGRAEELGYHTAWTFQRLLVPARPNARAGAAVYRSVHDPIVSLAFLAGRTSRIRLGLAVVNVPFFAPALLAKQLTTLDAVAGGRLDVGLGIGWMAEEYQAVGLPMARRGARAEEFLRALRALWSDEPVEFHGRFYDIPPARMQPKPVQRPHPPLLLGGSAEPALRRAGRLADGWISASTADLTRLGDMIAVVKRAAREAGRDSDALRFVCRGVVRVRPAGAAERPPLSGSVEEIRGDFDGLRAQGVTELFVDLNFDPEIGSPDADPTASLRRAEEALEAFAPA
jgi:probable F420-dependent oxidoreductase